MNNTELNLIKTEQLLEADPFKDIYGQTQVKKGLKSILLSGRHLILVGPPGIGKTTLAKNVALLLPERIVNNCEYHCNPETPLCPSCRIKKQRGEQIVVKTINGSERFVRIQGSPDLTVEDLLGDIDPVKALKFGPLSLEAFTPGKIFLANQGILFFDEVNRCSEKLQNSLLQVLEEGFATIGSYKVDLPANFIFIGTMNPNDASTEKLSDVFMDRFDILYVGYPESDAIEKKIVIEKSVLLGIELPDPLIDFIIKFVRDMRESDKLEKKPSVRATIGLYERAQANAKIAGRKKANFEDVKDAMISVLSHRIELKPSVKYLQKPEQFVEEEMQKFFEKHQDSLTSSGGDG